MMQHIMLFALVLTISLVNAQDNLILKVTPLDKPEIFAPNQWEDIIKKISTYAIDFKPTGTVKQPNTAGKSNKLINTHIIGGLTAKRGQFPWQTQVVMDGSRFCGGSLISKLWILTAAHCVFGFTNFEITLGSTVRNINETGRIVTLTTIKIMNAAYNNSSFANDVALLKLPKEVTLSTYIAVLRLPSIMQARLSFEKLNATVSGWGRIINSSSIALNLSYVVVPVMSNQACLKLLGSKYVIATTLCTSGTENKGICKGDSGGPLVIKEADGLYTQIGIVSFGSSSCTKMSPSAYARVTSFLGWISKYSNIAIRNK